ncbi:hypothetical protein BDQ17DRAFT_1335628 [Cyathus striatus]|nr:hypothetical protein BDQ17DRAFT_1335628 [Cyathus striatus]
MRVWVLTTEEKGGMNFGQPRHLFTLIHLVLIVEKRYILVHRDVKNTTMDHFLITGVAMHAKATLEEEKEEEALTLDSGLWIDSTHYKRSIDWLIVGFSYSYAAFASRCDDPNKADTLDLLHNGLCKLKVCHYLLAMVVKAGDGGWALDL